MAFDPQQHANQCPVICMIGTMGHGKSSFGNMLLGYEAFAVSDTCEEGTLKCHAKDGTFLSQTDLALGNSDELEGDISNDVKEYLLNRKIKNHPIKVIDTAGMGSKLSKQRIESIIKFLQETMDVTVIALIVNSQDNRIEPLKDIIDQYSKYISSDILLNHLLVVFTHWDLDKRSENKRKKNNRTKQVVASEFFASLRKSYPKINAFYETNTSKLPCVFISTDAFTDDDIPNNEKLLHLTELVKFYNIVKTKDTLSFKGGCFDDQCKIVRYSQLHGKCKKEECLVKDIKIGDKVETINGFENVVHIHKPLVNKAIVYEIKQENGTRISLTPKHLIYVNGKNDPIYACDVKIGDRLQGNNNKESSKIVDIKVGTADGVRSIITENGELIVENCRISSYAYSTKLHYLVKVKKMASILPIKTQKQLENLVNDCVQFFAK